MAENDQIVLAAIENAGKPLKAAEVAELTGLDKKEVSKIISALKKQGKIASPKACYYSPVK